MFKLFAAALLAASSRASPIEERTNNCQFVNGVVNIMRGQNVATPFCSSLLGISTVTSTATETSTPPASTVYTTVQSTDTVTTTSTSVVYGTTTVYPVVAVSTTSTCALGATVIPQNGGSKVKRGWGFQVYSPPPIGTPTCLTQFAGASITSACSCLNIPTPTSVTVTTTTLKQQTVTSTVNKTPAETTETQVTTSTSFTSTYSATQYYTSTFTILPSPSSISHYDDGSSFGQYPSLDFTGMDITNFFCYPGGPAPPSPYPSCTSYADCEAECVYYNDNNLGGNKKCGAVTYSAPDDRSSGSCYLKTGQAGCGANNAMTNSSVILPLVASDPQ